MESLHTPTLQIATTIVSFSSTLVMLLMWRSKTGIHGLGHWTLTIACFGCAFLLMSQTGNISPLFSLVLSAVLITGGFAIFHRGARAFTASPARTPYEIAAVAIIAFSFVFFTFVYHHPGIRALIQCTVVGLVSIAIAREFWLQRQMPWGLAALSVAGVFAFVGALMFGRTLIIVEDVNSYSYVTHQSVPLMNLFFMIVQITLTLSTLFLASAYLTNQLKAQAEKLEVSNVALSEFALIASHDLKEPLRTITSYAELLQQSKENELDELGKISLSFIHDAALRMHQLIEGLLQHSRIGQSIKTTHIETNELIRQILNDLKVVIEESHGSVTASALPVVNANETELRLLFQNLIANALKFRKPDEHPIVSIDVRQDGEFWQFSIRDNGIGICPTHHEKLFKIFSRLHDRSEYEGTGIGLAHCRKIVERYGGRIWVDSKPGCGSTFSFTLPAKAGVV